MAFPWDVLKWAVRAVYKLTPPAASDGELVDLQADANGNLKVRLVGEGPSAATPAKQLTGAKKGTLKASSGSVLELAIWNKSASAVWFQVHNKASDPTNGETCVDQVMVPAGGSLGWRPLVPVACATQARWAASSTPGTLTLIAGDDVGYSGAVL